MKLDLKEAHAEIAKQIKGEGLMSVFATNIDCQTYSDYERMLTRQYKEALELQARLQSRNGIDGDSGSAEYKELLDFTLGKTAALQTAMLTFRRVASLEKEIT